MKKFGFLFIFLFFISCSEDAIDPITPDAMDEEEVVMENESESEEDLTDENQSEDEELEVSFDISILVRNVNSDEKLLIDYAKGNAVENIDNLFNIDNAIVYRIPSDYDNIGNELFFWQRTPDRDVAKINIKSKEFQKFKNTDGVPDERLWEYDYRLYPRPTAERIATLESYNPSGIGNDTIFFNSLKIYNQLTEELEIMDLPDEDRLGVGFTTSRSNGELYLYLNEILQEDGSAKYQWKIVDLISKEIIAQFDTFNYDVNFAFHERKLYFSDGRTFEVDLNQFSQDFDFPYELGTPDMLNAQIKDNQIFFKATTVIKDGMIDGGVVLYDFETGESKKILEEELLLTTLEYFNDGGNTRYQEILQAHYDFDSGIISLTSSNGYPEYAVIFLDFDLNIIKVNSFDGYSPLKIMSLE